MSLFIFRPCVRAFCSCRLKAPGGGQSHDTFPARTKKCCACVRSRSDTLAAFKAFFFDPSRPAQGRCFEQRQNISSFCRSCTRFVIFILHDITTESLLETVTVAYVTMSSTCNLRFTWTVDNWMLTVFIPLVSYSAPMTLPLLHALCALPMHHGTGMMICLCLGSRSC